MITEREKQLWDLLDDIDTLGERLRPEINDYFKAVSRLCEKRHQILFSDGHQLYEPEISAPREFMD